MTKQSEEDRAKIEQGIQAMPAEARSDCDQLLLELFTDLRQARQALGALGNAADLVHKEAAIIQPFLAVWKQHGAVIEEARAALEKKS